MKIKDVLYKQTLVRVGPEKMVGIQRLIEEGHTGIAERHTVGKLFAYVKDLESQLGITVPDPDDKPNIRGFIKVNSHAGTYFMPAAA